ncbi:sulfotransferase [Microbaculum marinum]|uniref:Sulfotransferase n=1 Tax=Microbaculum marinum TaxID=1764581 RepID=A0AAW9RZY8_9HYPH
MSLPASPAFRSNYSALDRLLHRLALNVAPVAELSFDIDQAAYGRKKPDFGVETKRHVFVSGLARAGTTVLMRRFHETGAFRSLTYRDMPFVLAPNMWKSMSAASRSPAVSGERAHDDRLQVDVDSPESLDEVFWRIFTGDDYIRDGCLVPYMPDDEAVARFRRYVAAILPADRPDSRYLSKNNNNVLRLDGIRKAFPEALILVPFRDPVQQAASLRAQHARFIGLQRDDRFVRSYMTWLGHHEFGSDHRPFHLREGDRERLAAHSPDTLDYWLVNWTNVYGCLLESAPGSAVFVCYEDLCRDPAVWALLRTQAALDEDPVHMQPFELAAREVALPRTGAIEDAARQVYARLRERSGAVASGRLKPDRIPA